MTTMTTEQAVHEWFEHVWNEGDADFIENRLAESCEIVGLQPEAIRDRAGFRELHRAFNAALRDIDASVNHLVTSGDEFAGLVSVNAVHRRTGKPVHLQSGFCGSLVDGQIKHAANVVDFLPMLMAIEAVPEQALAAAMSESDPVG